MNEKVCKTVLSTFRHFNRRSLFAQLQNGDRKIERWSDDKNYFVSSFSTDLTRTEIDFEKSRDFYRVKHDIPSRRRTV